MTAELVTDALVMAIWRRGRPRELLHHSDRGSQYTSEAFQRLMAEHGVTCSLSRSGNVWDNAAMESFFSSLKVERVARKIYRTRDQARADVFDRRAFRPLIEINATGGRRPKKSSAFGGPRRPARHPHRWVWPIQSGDRTWPPGFAAAVTSWRQVRQPRPTPTCRRSQPLPVEEIRPPSALPGASSFRIHRCRILSSPSWKCATSLRTS